MTVDTHKRWTDMWQTRPDLYNDNLPHPNILAKIQQSLEPFITNVPESEYVLDLGSGRGPIRYLPVGFDTQRLHAIDVTSEALAGNPAGKKIIADIREPFPMTDKYGLVTSFSLLSSLTEEEQLKVIQHALNVLRPGSWMLNVEFRDQKSFLTANRRFVPEELAAKLEGTSGIRQIKTEVVFPACYTDEDYTPISELDLIAVQRSI